MTRFLSLVICAVLVGCAPAPAPVDTDMRSVVLFDTARFAGDWIDVATGAPWHVAPNAARITHPNGNGAAEMIGPGRLKVAGLRAPLWVLWVDEGYRTIVLGTPDRSFAYILNRGADIAPDRLRAAREILDWNGYDLGASG